MPSDREALSQVALYTRFPEEFIERRIREIRLNLLSQSRYLREPNFTRIHPSDLEFLFDAYDRGFFAGHCRGTLQGRKLGFRLSLRMTHAGGKTTRFISRSGEVSFEIAIAISMLFDGFGRDDRSVTVCGLPCEDRLQAFQRILEHEIVHLVEQLCWDSSNCSAGRFQDIARRMFLHRVHTHQLITRRERAADSGIHVGSNVMFLFEDRQLTGRVNRITKRASVLVKDPDGRKYSDGCRYRKYYVPLGCLQLVQPGEERETKKASTAN
jgi:hypothetical protein